MKVSIGVPLHKKMSVLTGHLTVFWRSLTVSSAQFIGNDFLCATLPRRNFNGLPKEGWNISVIEYFFNF